MKFETKTVLPSNNPENSLLFHSLDTPLQESIVASGLSVGALIRMNIDDPNAASIEFPRWLETHFGVKNTHHHSNTEYIPDTPEEFANKYWQSEPFPGNITEEQLQKLGGKATRDIQIELSKVYSTNQ